MNNPTKHKINSIVSKYEHSGTIDYCNYKLCEKELEDEFGSLVTTHLEDINKAFTCNVYYSYSIAWVENNKPRLLVCTVEPDYDTIY